MNENKVSDNREAWISYKDDLGKVISGFVTLIEQTGQFIKFKTQYNVITINYSQLIKLKEKIE